MPGRVRKLLTVWFGFVPLDRSSYRWGGAALLLAQLVLQTAAIFAITGKLVGPLTIFSPFISTRVQALPLLPDTVLWSLMALNLPFIWAGTSMSIRRAVDAGFSASVGCVFLLPLLNVVLVLVLALAPTPARRRPVVASDPTHPSFIDLFSSATAGAAVALCLCALSVYGIRSYGGVLFLITPFVMGFVVGYLHNRREPRGQGATAAAVVLSLGLTFGGLIVFAMEGIVCIAMAAPPALALALPGGFAGQMAAQRTALRLAHLGVLLLSLPLLMGAEARRQIAPLHEVTSSIEIAAPPQVVWPRVVGFTDLPPPSELVFRLGIAYPQRARISGRGIGAIRHCEFSTGAFVEPITRWDEPSRLSFDVISQPHPMHEWSPYQHVNAPHLVGNMRSKRGEFRLVPLPNGGTRLEGSTWYELEMFPQTYWLLWSDTLVHAIHTRVLAHIKRLAEADAAEPRA